MSLRSGPLEMPDESRFLAARAVTENSGFYYENGMFGGGIDENGYTLGLDTPKRRYWIAMWMKSNVDNPPRKRGVVS